jgi:hypothetical protein
LNLQDGVVQIIYNGTPISLIRAADEEHTETITGTAIIQMEVNDKVSDSLYFLLHEMN